MKQRGNRTSGPRIAVRLDSGSHINAVAEQLVGYQRGLRLLATDQKAFSGEHFRHFYSVVLPYFAAVAYTVNPFLKEHLAGCVIQVAPDGDVAGAYLRDADLERWEYDDDDDDDDDSQEDTVSASILPGPAYLENLAALAWQHLATRFPGVAVGDIARLTGFKLVASREAAVSLDRIKRPFA